MLGGRMRIPSLAVLVAFPWMAPALLAQVPAGLVVEGIPEAPPELRAGVGRYLEYRTATFQDWHPRRRDVLITTRFGDVPQLHEVVLPLGVRRQVSFLSERVAGASYQPTDGDRIVFLQDSGGSEFFQLHRLDRTNGLVSLLTDGRSRNTEPQWARVSGRLAYASTRRNGRDTDLYVMDPGRPETDRRVVELSGSGWSVLDWSPDERHLLVRSFVSINESYLHRVEVETGARELLTPVTGERVSHAAARFLGDGRSVLVATDRGDEYRQLAILDFSTGTWRAAFPPAPGDVDAFDLSPDRKRVAFIRNEEGVSALYQADLARGRVRRVGGLPLGVVDGVRWHANGREVAFTLSSARAPNDVYSADLRKGGITRWTESESGGLPVSRFAEPELVRVRAADGVALSGFLYRPEARRFPGPRPVVVSLHGGPEAQARPGFQGRWNYLLEELGVAILYPNVRGSSGYGKTFLRLDNGREREAAVRDVGVFLDWIGTQAGLDASRVGAYGGSYGGYLVLASLVEHGSRLRCGIDVVGISSFPTFLRNTQDYRRDLRREEYGDEREPEMAEFLHRISPLTRVDRIRRPLLVVQGRNDPRVPASEAEQMVNAVRGQGGIVWYLLAEDEGHGFARKKNVDFMFLAIVQFLKAHLVGP
jgi:dipeptidyl aminopeptidase/acylaminoacyl peptidase